MVILSYVVVRLIRFMVCGFREFVVIVLDKRENMFYNPTLVVSLKIVYLSYRILRSCLTLSILLMIFNYSKSWQYCITFQSLIIITYFPSVSLAIVSVKNAIFLAYNILYLVTFGEIVLP